jgi:hypothetical protein
MPGAERSKAMRTIIRSKGGTSERTVKVEDIAIPDLWHVAMRQTTKADKEAILETWHLCHDLLRAIKAS